MTAASAFAYSTMEVPAVDDSMEMASPYQGHVDDFDIDIDIMEDHASNMDSDMIVADDYPATSQPADYTNDADMADGPPEGSMVDADENYANEDHDVEVQYEGEQALETEMLEEDAEEDIDAPIPAIHLETPAAAEEETNNISLSSTAAAEEKPPDAINPLPQTTLAEISTQDSEHHEQSIHPEPSTTEHGPPEHIFEETDAAQPEVDHEQPALAEETNEAVHADILNASEDHAHHESAAENPETSQVKAPAAETQAEDAERLEAHPAHEQGDHGTRSGVALHPVKVLYQDNEVSLFPPLEGDSSETFFLQDENVAYDDFGKLFRALREVLEDNVAENETLVIDIDSLGIQITEDSSSLSKVSLHQVLDLYLKLCRNDGSDEPEALYFTLSSRLTVAAEIADLLTAAYEGKGLSQILSWEEHDEVNTFENETQAGQAHVGSNDKSGIRAQDGHDTQEEDLEVPGDDIPGREDGGMHATAQSEVAASQAEQEEANPPKHLDHQEEEILSQGEEYANEETYDSEGQRSESESTNTVVPLSRSTEIKDPEEDMPTDVTQQAAAQDNDGYFPEGAELGDETYSGEGEANDIVGCPEEFEDDFAGNDTGDTSAGNDAPPAEYTSTATHHEEDIDAPHAASEYGDASADETQDRLEHSVHDEPQPTPASMPQNVPAGPEHTPEPTDDLLGISEDLLQTPAQDAQNGHAEQADIIEEGDYLEDFDASETVEGDDAADEQFDDDNQNIEATEARELGETSYLFTDSQPHDTLSGKRSREVEEDWDAVENTTPDTKKRRAS